MSFDTRAGTRGGWQPGTGGPIGRWYTKRIVKRIRRTGKLMGLHALVLTTIGRKSGAERTTPVMGWLPDDGGAWLIAGPSTADSCPLLAVGPHLFCPLGQLRFSVAFALTSIALFVFTFALCLLTLPFGGVLCALTSVVRLLAVVFPLPFVLEVAVGTER